MPTSARKKHRVGTGGPWGTGLLLLGVAVAVQGVGYITPRPEGLTGALRALSSIAPIQVWGGLWVAAGLYAVVKALRPPQKHRDVWPVVAVTSLWSAAYLAYWLVAAVFYGELTRSWTSGVAWGSLTVLIVSWGKCTNPPVTR